MRSIDFAKRRHANNILRPHVTNISGTSYPNKRQGRGWFASVLHREDVVIGFSPRVRLMEQRSCASQLHEPLHVYQQFSLLMSHDLFFATVGSGVYSTRHNLFSAA